VLFIAFVGKDAVPGDSADWSAASATVFEDSIGDMGDSLVERVGVDGHYGDDGDDNDDDDDSASGKNKVVDVAIVGAMLAMAVGLVV